MISANRSYTDEDFSDEVIDETELTNITFTGCRFRRTDFSDVKTIFKCTFDTCDFANAHLNGVEILNSSFLSCTFRGASLFAAKFRTCKMTASDFKDCECALMQVEGGDWSYANLYKLSFQKQDFCGIRFIGADLSYCHFNQCKMNECEFDDAVVRETSFYRCDMRGSSMRGLNLFEVSLKEAQLDLNQCVAVAENFTQCRFTPEPVNV